MRYSNKTLLGIRSDEGCSIVFSMVRLVKQQVRGMAGACWGFSMGESGSFPIGAVAGHS